MDYYDIQKALAFRGKVIIDNAKLPPFGNLHHSREKRLLNIKAKKEAPFIHSIARSRMTAYKALWPDAESLT